MTVIDPGHYYSLLRLDADKGGDLTLRFVMRVGDKYPGNKNTYPGTTLQEVLRACLDRVGYLHRQKRHWSNCFVYCFISFSIWFLELRAAHIHKRRVPNLLEAIHGTCCPKCLHVGHRCV